MALNETDIDSILNEYDAEECTDVRRARARLDEIDDEFQRLVNRRLEAIEALELAEHRLLLTANEEDWEV